MTEAKRFLRSVRDIDRRIEREEEEIERLRAKLEAGRLNVLTGMPRGGQGDWTATADSLIELEKKHNARIREMCRLKIAAVDAVDAVEEARYREVLDLYYLKGLTWEQVATTMGLDLRWVYRLHGRALTRIRVPEEKE